MLRLPALESISLGVMPTVKSNGITLAYERFHPEPDTEPVPANPSHGMRGWARRIGRRLNPSSEIREPVKQQPEPLLLIMGLGGQLIDWPRGFIDELLTRGFDVIAFDNRDAGASELLDLPVPSIVELAVEGVLARQEKVPYLIKDMADDAADLLEALDIGSAHVVGASMGGMIAQSMAIHHPLKVRSLTSIMSMPGDRFSGRVATSLALRLTTMIPPPDERDPDAVVDYISEIQNLIAGPRSDEASTADRARLAVERGFSFDGLRRQLAAVAAGPDRTSDLQKLRVPTLVIHGDKDRLITVGGGQATARAVPGSVLLTFPDMGHDLPPTRWSHMATAISGVATEARARPSTFRI